MATIAGKILRGIFDVGKAAVGVVTFQPSVSKAAINDLNSLTGANQAQAKLTAHIIANENLANANGLNKNPALNTTTANVTGFLTPGLIILILSILGLFLISNNKKK
jgi:hypothetical protein